MDKDNWRVDREPSEEGARNDDPLTRPWKRLKEPPPPQNSFSVLRGGPSYTDKQSGRVYRGGHNPTRGPFVTPTLRSTGPIARDPKAEQAIEEGRRLYVGNLPYDAQIGDVRSLFADISHSIQDISMSVDPITGRNPSYCFVDFTSKLTAKKTLQHYNGITFMRRPLKVKPAVKAGDGKGRYHLKRDLQSIADSSSESPSGDDQTPYAFTRWRRLDAQYDPEEINAKIISEERRLFVGGLPRFPDQVTCNLKMKELFKGYNVETVSKPISPHTSLKTDPGNNYYCFVDLATTEEVDKAVAELDGIEMFNWNLRISRSSRVSGKLRERQRVNIHGLPDVLGTHGETKLVEELKHLLQPFGEVEVMSKIFFRRKNEKAGLNSGCYCFVEFAEAYQADAATRALDGTEFLGSKLCFRASKHRGALEEHFLSA